MKDFQRILDFLYADNDLVCICTIPDFMSRKQRFCKVADLKQDKWQKFLRASNARGSNIYLSVYPFMRNERTEDAVVNTVNRIFLDFDMPGSYERFRRDYEPSIVIQTSLGKHQVILMLSEGVNKTEAKAISRTLARRYNADNTFDLARIFRLPGYRNLKYPERPLVVIEEFNPQTTYSPYNLPAEISKPASRQREKKDISSIVSRQNNATAGFLHNRIPHDYRYFLEKAPLKAGKNEKDYSRADFSYAIYRLGQGDDEQAIMEILMTESPDIQERKGAGLENYLEKTIERAKMYQHQHYKPYPGR